MRRAIRVERGRWSRDRAEDPPATLDALERLVASRRRLPIGYLLGRWARSASPQDREEAWRRVFAERDPQRLRRRLQCLRHAPDDRLRTGLLALAEHGDRRVRTAALRLLADVKDARIRRWALDALRRDPAGALRDGVLDLFEVNGTTSDAAALAAVLPARRSGDADDDWVSGVLHAARPIRAAGFPEVAPRTGPAWDALLVRAYEIAPCRECRWGVVETLAERGTAPEWMLREALWDSQRETRAVARKALRAARPRKRRR
jgi:hypothetical protein